MKAGLTLFAILSLVLITFSLHAQDDWIIVSSASTTAKTVEQLQQAIQQKGFKLFNTIDHAAGAESVDMSLRPTTLLVFGNPKGGTVVMNCDQKMGMILPLRILVWEDESKQVKAGFINPEKYAKEYNLEKCKEALTKMKAVLQGLLAVAEKK
ncbi:hypothetical protein WSM22_01400 [Cytophagales bacterium WSM2-2]|nr:hypothetical protein WSM22_01400 [Cytophagales bacterium WSM2-2]